MTQYPAQLKKIEAHIRRRRQATEEEKTLIPQANQAGSEQTTGKENSIF